VQEDGLGWRKFCVLDILMSLFAACRTDSRSHNTERRMNYALNTQIFTKLCIKKPCFLILSSGCQVLKTNIGTA
jgi:hypothetical protein